MLPTNVNPMQVTENQQGTDGAKPAGAAPTDAQTAAQQTAAAAVPAAGAAPAAEPPEEEKFTVHVPEGLTYFDLDLIKMTAQFVARNGKGFLTGVLLFVTSSLDIRDCYSRPGKHVHDN